VTVGNVRLPTAALWEPGLESLIYHRAADRAIGLATADMD
jgi:hypothetical protein